MEFPGISPIGLLDEHKNESKWDSVDDLDAFFKSMYHYYAAQGLPAIILTEACELLTLGFTIAFSVFLIAFLDWESIVNCRDEESCHERAYTHNPFATTPSLFSFLMIVYFILFGTVWLWKAVAAVNAVKDAIDMESFYRETLGVKLEAMQQMEWHEIIHRLVVLREHGVYRVNAHHNANIFRSHSSVVTSASAQGRERRIGRDRNRKEDRTEIDRVGGATSDDTAAGRHSSNDGSDKNGFEFTEHDVALRIMRKDNYMIGMINRNLLELHVPWWASTFLLCENNQLFLTKSLEWSLNFCILDYMFDDASCLELSENFLNDAEGLKWRFQVVGVINLLLTPFMLLFMTIHFFLQNAQKFHSNRSYLGPRQWSPLALWRFREFNELPHVFEERINLSYAPTNDYILTFNNRYTETVARCVTYICGAYISVLLLLSVISEDVLLHFHLGEHNLLWFLGIFSAIYACSTSLIPDETKGKGEDPELLLTKSAAHTHYYPEHWINNSKTWKVREEVADMFQYKARIFLMEVFSVVLTPMVLCFSLPECVPKVLAFIREHSEYVEGVGVVCDYSLFDFTKYGDERYGSRTSGYLDPAERLADGKLEKSFLSFQRSHPHYEAGVGARELSQRMQAFKDTTMANQDRLISSVLGGPLSPHTTHPAQPTQHMQALQPLPYMQMQYLSSVSGNGSLPTKSMGGAGVRVRVGGEAGGLSNGFNYNAQLYQRNPAERLAMPAAAVGVDIDPALIQQQFYPVGDSSSLGTRPVWLPPGHPQMQQYIFQQQQQQLLLQQQQQQRFYHTHAQEHQRFQGGTYYPLNERECDTYQQQRSKKAAAGSVRIDASGESEFSDDNSEGFSRNILVLGSADDPRVLMAAGLAQWQGKDGRQMKAVRGAEEEKEGEKEREKLSHDVVSIDGSPTHSSPTTHNDNVNDISSNSIVEQTKAGAIVSTKTTTSSLIPAAENDAEHTRTSTGFGTATGLEAEIETPTARGVLGGGRGGGGLGARGVGVQGKQAWNSIMSNDSNSSDGSRDNNDPNFPLLKEENNKKRPKNERDGSILTKASPDSDSAVIRGVLHPADVGNQKTIAASSTQQTETIPLFSSSSTSSPTSPGTLNPISLGAVNAIPVRSNTPFPPPSDNQVAAPVSPPSPTPFYIIPAGQPLHALSPPPNAYTAYEAPSTASAGIVGENVSDGLSKGEDGVRVAGGVDVGLTGLHGSSNALVSSILSSYSAASARSPNSPVVSPYRLPARHSQLSQEQFPQQQQQQQHSLLRQSYQTPMLVSSSLSPLFAVSQEQPQLFPSVSASSADLPGVLRSILKHENIDYENDIYWINRFRNEKLLFDEQQRRIREQDRQLNSMMYVEGDGRNSQGETSRTEGSTARGFARNRGYTNEDSIPGGSCVPSGGSERRRTATTRDGEGIRMGILLPPGSVGSDSKGASLASSGGSSTRSEILSHSSPAISAYPSAEGKDSEYKPSHLLDPPLSSGAIGMREIVTGTGREEDSRGRGLGLSGSAAAKLASSGFSDNAISENDRTPVLSYPAYEVYGWDNNSSDVSSQQESVMLPAGKGMAGNSSVHSTDRGSSEMHLHPPPPPSEFGNSSAMSSSNLSLSGFHPAFVNDINHSSENSPSPGSGAVPGLFSTNGRDGGLDGVHSTSCTAMSPHTTGDPDVRLGVQQGRSELSSPRFYTSTTHLDNSHSAHSVPHIHPHSYAHPHPQSHLPQQQHGLAYMTSVPAPPNRITRTISGTDTAGSSSYSSSYSGQMGLSSGAGATTVGAGNYQSARKISPPRFSSPARSPARPPYYPRSDTHREYGNPQQQQQHQQQNEQEQMQDKAHQRNDRVPTHHQASIYPLNPTSLSAERIITTTDHSEVRNGSLLTTVGPPQREQQQQQQQQHQHQQQQQQRERRKDGNSTDPEDPESGSGLVSV